MASVQAEVDRMTFQRRRGRPAVDISEEQITMLLEHGFTQSDIARMMNVSARTIRRRINQFGLESLTLHSDL